MDKYKKVKKFYSEVGKDTTNELILTDRLEEFLSHIKKGGSIIDIGCGPGHDVDYFIRRGYDATGVDFSEKYIEYARGKYAGRFEVDDMLARGFFDKYSFDNVWLSAVIMHLDENNRTEFFRNMCQAMPVGGILGIIAPKKNKDDVWQKKWRDYGGVLNTFGKKEIESIIKKSRFSIIIIKQFDYSRRPWFFILAGKRWDG